LAQNQPESKHADETGRVLRFRQRRRLDPPALRPTASAHRDGDADDDLAQYEQDEDVDYRQRMLMNVIALAIVAVLVGLGVWIADTMAGMEKDQDCVLQGRGNCAPIEAATSRLH
jgi:hypothetical protein